MFKNQVILELKRADRIYKLEVPDNCTLGEIFDVLCEARGFVVEKISEVIKADQAKKDAEPVEAQKE